MFSFLSPRTRTKLRRLAASANMRWTRTQTSTSDDEDADDHSKVIGSRSQVGFWNRNVPRKSISKMLKATVTTLSEDRSNLENGGVSCTYEGGQVNERDSIDSNGSVLLQMLQVAPRVKTCRDLTLDFMKQMNQHDLQAARSMVTDDYHTVYGDHEMKWDDFAMETQKIFDAFPDFTFSFQKVEERGDVIVLHHFIPFGTHTGTAYAFGPCESVEPTGKQVRNDPEEVHFTFRGNKICRNAVFCDGDLKGPAGIYAQIGGFPML